LREGRFGAFAEAELGDGHVGVFAGQLEAREDGLDPGAIRAFGHAGFERSLAGVERFGFLREVAELDVLGNGDRSGGWGEFAADGSEERCFAAAVGALDGPALAAAEGEVEVVEDRLGAVGEG